MKIFGKNGIGGQALLYVGVAWVGGSDGFMVRRVSWYIGSKGTKGWIARSVRECEKSDGTIVQRPDDGTVIRKFKEPIRSQEEPFKPIGTHHNSS